MIWLSIKLRSDPTQPSSAGTLSCSAPKFKGDERIALFSMAISGCRGTDVIRFNENVGIFFEADGNPNAILPPDVHSVNAEERTFPYKSSLGAMSCFRPESRDAGRF